MPAAPAAPALEPEPGREDWDTPPWDSTSAAAALAAAAAEVPAPRALLELGGTMLATDEVAEDSAAARREAVLLLLPATFTVVEGTAEDELASAPLPES